jgi:uncharacterized phiE125 gp8 family phage protein
LAYDLGDTATPSIEIRDSAGTLAAGGAVTATITLPDGTTAPGGQVTISNPSTGLYRASYVTVMVGLHAIRWVVTGANSGTHEDGFDVDTPRGVLVSLPDLKRYLRISLVDVGRDDELRDVLDAATTLCEDHTGRTYRRQTYTETYDGGRTAIALRRTPAQTITTITEGATTVTEYVLDPTSGLLYRGTATAPGCWAWGTQNITITYIAGAPTVSPRVTEAVLVTTAHLWDTRRGGSNLPRQTGTNGEYASGAPWALPRRAEQLLAPDLAPGIA